MKKTQIDLTPLENSLKALQEAVTPKNQLERDGAIHRYEFTFEISWKTLAKVLQADRPLEDNSVRGVLREGAKQGLILNVERWFEFHHARNLTSHTYDPKIVEQVFAIAIQILPFVEDLIKQLRSRLQK